MPSKPLQGRMSFRLLASVSLLLVHITLLAATCMANTGKELLYTQQLQAIGRSHLTEKREFDDLLTILNGQETILVGERCQLDIDEGGLGLLVLTNQRIIFVDEFFAQRTAINIPLPNITNVTNGKNVFWSSISLTSDSQTYTFTNLKKYAAATMASRINQFIQQVHSKNPLPQSSLGQELEHLHRLKEQGILTPYEFDQAKIKLLQQS